MDKDFRTTVELFERDDDWCVRRVDSGTERIDTFPTERFAILFAEHERIRLGLESFERDDFAIA